MERKTTGAKIKEGYIRNADQRARWSITRQRWEPLKSHALAHIIAGFWVRSKRHDVLSDIFCASMSSAGPSTRVAYISSSFLGKRHRTARAYISSYIWATSIKNVSASVQLRTCEHLEQSGTCQGSMRRWCKSSGWYSVSCLFSPNTKYNLLYMCTRCMAIDEWFRLVVLDQSGSPTLIPRQASHTRVLGPELLLGTMSQSCMVYRVVGSGPSMKLGLGESDGGIEIHGST